MKTALSVFLGICLGLLFAGLLILMWQSSAGTPVVLLSTATIPPTVVEISGAVVSPGVYAVPRAARVQEVLQAAGGLTDAADTLAINQAARVRDGEKIIIPTRLPPGVAAAAPVDATKEQAPSAARPLNLNLASAEQLDALPGIGPARAADIIAYREAQGGFSSIDQLKNIPGIGEVTYNRLKDLVSVSP